MKYTTEIIIELPRDVCIKKLDNADNMKHWQPGLTSWEMISGKSGEDGAKMCLLYDMGKRKVELVETIIKNSFPSEFHTTYETKGMLNIQHNHFEETAEGHTKWISHSEFQFSSFFMKLMGFLMPSAFKKESAKYLLNFKNFAEKGSSVAI